MLFIGALLVVLIVAGASFALHILWVLAVILFLALWLIGRVIGRGEGVGGHRFYRW